MDQKKKEKSKVDLDRNEIQDRLKNNLQGDKLAEQLRADLGATNPATTDVFSHRKIMRPGGLVRDKLDNLQNVDADLSQPQANLPENLKQKLKRLDDLAKPKKDATEYFNF